MKKLNLLLLSLMATVLLFSSFTNPVTSTKAKTQKVALAGIAVGTWYWVDPATPDLSQEFTVYVESTNPTQVIGLKLLGTSSLRGATGTYTGSSVYNVNSTAYLVVNGYGDVY